MHNTIFKLLFFSFFILIISNGCLKNEDPIPIDPRPQSVIDDSLIQNYLVKNSLTAIKHSSGLYYIIKTEGTGINPSLSNQVTVHYKGYLLTGSQFDGTTTTPVTFRLGGLIQGWQIGIPLIKKGGDIKLLLPSDLAYGQTGSGSIGPNQVLIFDIQLVNVY
ncbi:MAG: FKBP-type peptidyl-prolyl cis-trans isomerase [Saprospiraceae bacterium]